MFIRRLKQSFELQVTSRKENLAGIEVTRQAEVGSKGIHIPSLKIDRFRSIIGLEIPRLAQLNLIAGDNDLLRSSMLGSVVDIGDRDSRVVQPDWWDDVELENEDEILISTSDQSGTLVMDSGEPFGGDGIEIRHLGHALTLPTGRFGKDWVFFISNLPEVFKAGGLVEHRLLDPDLQNQRRNAHLDSAKMISLSGFVIRVHSGRFELGWLVGSPEDSRLKFIDVFEIGWDAVRAMILMSAISVVPEAHGVGGRKTVLLIDNIDVPVNRTLHAAFWELIVDALVAREAQLLATTNSFDCIAGFADAGVSRPDTSLLFFRLQQGEHQTDYVDYDPLTLQVSFDTGIDPR